MDLKNNKKNLDLAINICMQSSTFSVVEAHLFKTLVSVNIFSYLHIKPGFSPIIETPLHNFGLTEVAIL